MTYLRLEKTLILFGRTFAKCVHSLNCQLLLSSDEFKPLSQTYPF